MLGFVPLGSMPVDAVEGKKLLNALFSIPLSGNSTYRSKAQFALECLVYARAVERTLDSINTPMPDEHLNYNHLLDASEKLFQEIYPGEEFLATTSLSDEHRNYAESELDS